ncbi:hypothetical protein G6F42_023750 [Rhizopus arrhizus]|nr:hypothetical protein G6F42_023750 [Rhizopus arrhizus]
MGLFSSSSTPAKVTCSKFCTQLQAIDARYKNTVPRETDAEGVKSLALLLFYLQNKDEGDAFEDKVLEM